MKMIMGQNENKRFNKQYPPKCRNITNLMKSTRVYINYNQLNEKYTSLYKRLNPIWNRLVNDSLLNDLLNTVQEENKDIPTLLVNIRTM